MANTINYAAIFNQILDEKFYIMPRTSYLENTMPGLVWNNGKEIKVPKLAVAGLGNMVGNKAPDGDLTLDYETKQLEYYRGRNFSIGRYDIEETNLTLTVTNVLKTLMGEQVVPEVDRIRIAKIATKALQLAGTHVSTATITASNALTSLLNDIAAVQDKIGEDKQLYIQISTTVKNLLEQDEKVKKYLDAKDMAIKDVNLKIKTLNEQFLIGTPSAYMKTAINLSTGRDADLVGGVEVADLAVGVNWVITARGVADAIARPRVSKVISPDVNQEGEFWKIMFNIYHGVWTYDSKTDGLLINVVPTLGAVTATSVAGATSGKTKITVAEGVPAGCKFVYKVADAATTVAFGDALKAASGWVDLTSDDITAASGKVATIACVALDSCYAIASGTVTVVAHA